MIFLSLPMWRPIKINITNFNNPDILLINPDILLINPDILLINPDIPAFFSNTRVD